MVNHSAISRYPPSGQGFSEETNADKAGHKEAPEQDHALSVRAVAELPKAEIQDSSKGGTAAAEAVSLPVVGLALSDKALEGKRLFIQQAQPGCGVCHSLADADARGVVGPNLNQLSPSFAQVERAIAQGIGAMPAYGTQLSQNEIEALAAYVVEATR